MSSKNQDGFSLIEILIVLVIIGVIMTITVPYLLKAKGAAEDSNAKATMRTMVSSQYNYYSHYSRYARLDELNDSQSGAFGIVTGTDLVRGSFTFQMSPITPLDVDLKDNFTIIATKATGGNELPYAISITQRGEVVQVLP
jgi:type IV pilus assembly protein PilA